MGFSCQFRRGIWSVVIVLLLASPLSAQIGDNLTAYTGKNAEGYLDPLASALGGTLGSGAFRSAHIPIAGFHLSIEFPMVGTYFNDDDDHFMGTTELGFSPETTAEVPTVVGPTGSVTVPGDGGTIFTFPGGFDIGSFAIVAPQLKIGSVLGTEALVRFVAFKIGDSELGDVMLLGFGARHSISQYLGEMPFLDLSASFLWQDLKLGENENGDDLTSTSSLSLGLQGSKQLGNIITPYAGLYYKSYTTDVTYISEVTGTEESVEISFDDSFVQLTIGLEFNLWILNVWGEYNMAERQSFGAGLGLGL